MSARQGSDLPIAVLDTSVLIPRWSRVALQFLAAEDERRYRPLWSEWIIAETWYILADRAARAGVARATTSVQAKRMLRYLLEVMEFASEAKPPLDLPISPLRDVDDAPIWATAILGGAQYIVSHNTNDFPPLVEEIIRPRGQRSVVRRHLHQGVEFLTAIEFIEDVPGVDVTTALQSPLPARGVVRSRRAVTPA